MAKNKCLANGCDRPAHARGYCSSHYGQMWRGGECRNIVPKYRQVRDDETIRLERELESMQYHLVESQDIYEKVVGIEGRIAAIRRIKELNINIRIIEKAIAAKKARGVVDRNEFYRAVVQPAIENLPKRLRQIEGVEVGVRYGENAKAILSAMPYIRLYLVDPWKHQKDYIDTANVSDRQHEENMAFAISLLNPYHGRYFIQRMTSIEAAKLHDTRSLCFVYLDARHDYASVCQDLKAWWPKICKGGILSGHDYVDGHINHSIFGVKSAVSDFAKRNNRSVNITDEPNFPTWWIVK